MRLTRRSLVAMSLSLLLAACSAAGEPSRPTVPASPSVSSVATAPVASPTLPPQSPDAQSVLPHCEGMQNLKDPVKLDWPNLEQRKQEFISTAWQYYSCEQPPAEVAAQFRQQLPKPPYNMEETNWIERQEGRLGIYFSQTGLWHYIWFIPQRGDPQKSYVVVAESFASVEC